MRAGLRCLKGAAPPGPAPGRGAALTDGRSWRGGGGVRSRTLPRSSPRCCRRSGEGLRGPALARGCRLRPGSNGGRGAVPEGSGARAGGRCRPSVRPGPGVAPRGKPAWRCMWPLREGGPQFPGLGVRPETLGLARGLSGVFLPRRSGAAQRTRPPSASPARHWVLWGAVAGAAACPSCGSARGSSPGLAGTGRRGTPGPAPEERRGAGPVRLPPRGEAQAHAVHETTLIRKGRRLQRVSHVFLTETRKHRLLQKGFPPTH